MVAKQVQLTLVIHNHQPVGNLDHVIEEACLRAYMPFLELMLDFPEIRFGLHTSGCLWEWMQTRFPGYFDLVRELLRRKQIELLSGGMYEPILPVLPEQDGAWQLARMGKYLDEHFNVRPVGMWCAERVWEPQMPKLIAQADIRYTLLDDYHFRSSVLPEQLATDYFLTDHAGSSIALLPISRQLRYLIPFKPAPDTLQYLSKIASTSGYTPLVVYGDDGEKFGVWPETHEWVYEKGWLRTFLQALTDNLDWITVLLPHEVIARRHPAGTVYLPCAAYAEMGEWARVDPDADDDDPPGFWRNYLYKYPEANAMYRRMLGVSENLAKAREAGIDGSKLASIADDLGRAQCNCAYWHGIFGGIYLNYLRDAISYHLLKAETKLREIAPSLYRQRVTLKDHDAKGWKQVILQENKIYAQLDPAHGLCLSRLDYYPSCYCWTDVLARRREAYHRKLRESGKKKTKAHASIHDRVVTKAANLDRMLATDSYPRMSLVGFFTEAEELDRLIESQDTTYARPPQTHNDYFVPVTDLSISDSSVAGKIGFGEFRVIKSALLHENGLDVSISKLDGQLPETNEDYFVELNVTALTEKAADRYLQIAEKRYHLDRAWHILQPASILLVDEWKQHRLAISASVLTSAFIHPVFTISSSEGGFERTYQGTCILLRFEPRALCDGIQIEIRAEDL